MKLLVALTILATPFTSSAATLICQDFGGLIVSEIELNSSAEGNAVGTTQNSTLILPVPGEKYVNAFPLYELGGGGGEDGDYTMSAQALVKDSLSLLKRRSQVEYDVTIALNGTEETGLSYVVTLERPAGVSTAVDGNGLLEFTDCAKF